MKKFISLFLSAVLCCTYSPVCVNAVEMTEDTSVTVENSPELWERFLKYDLCILDYDSLTSEEKDLCKFIFETEQSTTDTIYCERARRTLLHDENIGERLTLDVIKSPDFYNVCNKYSDFGFSRYHFTHCVPDIINYDITPEKDCFTYEYWLDDNGDNKIIQDGSYVGFKIPITDENWEYLALNGFRYDIETDSLNGKEYYKILNNFAKSMSEENIIEDDGNTYYLCPDNTLVLIESKYIYGRIVSTEETVVIPEKVNGYPVTAIGFSAFTNATIKKIALPETIEYIEADAFYNCQFLEEINFPENLKYIGNSAFWYTNLKDIKINCPELIIGRASFAQVSPVTAEINAKSIGELAFSACNNLENLKLGNDIEEIKSNAFTNIKCTDIVLPENLKYLGTEAFYRDSKPKKITIPKSVEIIGTLPLSHGSDNLSIGYIPPLNSLLQEYECVAPNGSIVSGYYDTEAHSYALAHNLKFNPLDDVISGDANDDGKVSIADMVSLSQHILNSRDVSWGADLTKDGRIDSFDMVLMREMILNK